MNDLPSLLDRIAALKEAEEFEVLRDDVGEGGGDMADAVRMVLLDRDLRPEHRERVFEDLLSNRELLEGEATDPRLVSLIVWGEHVERLYTALRKGGLQTFHYARALEATCRRAGFELLPVMGQMEELGKAWSHRKYAETLEMFQPTS